MKVIAPDSPGYETELSALNRRHIPPADVTAAVAAIIAQVREKGDAALCALAEKYDRVRLRPDALAVGRSEWSEGVRKVPKAGRAALEAAHANVMAFARRSLRKNWKMKNVQGAEVGEIFQPFRRVGLYVPGGSAPLVSTVLMTATLAQAAGCEEIVVCTPCDRQGRVNPAMLLALKLTGATEIFKIGGAQAIAALAYGTQSVRAVDKIFGPGNKYVVEAKRQVFGAAAVDLLPGPSEIMVLCDDSADPRFVAADLLAQAEHGHDGQILLATPSAKILTAVQEEMENQLRSLPRAEIIREILDSGAWLVQVPDLDAGVRLCNDFAPEHLSLIVRNERLILPKIRTAGAIFCGNYSPVAAGDFVAGPSHTLPTGGAGKSFAGLTADQFQRRTSIVRLDAAALARTAPLVETFAAMEGLLAHGRSATLRAGGKKKR
jgi:histidinol dehydrogenase